MRHIRSFTTFVWAGVLGLALLGSCGCGHKSSSSGQNASSSPAPIADIDLRVLDAHPSFDSHAVVLAFTLACDGGIGSVNAPWVLKQDGTEVASGIAAVAANGNVTLSARAAEAVGTHQFTLVVNPNAVLAEMSLTNNSITLDVTNNATGTNPTLDLSVVSPTANVDAANVVAVNFSIACFDSAGAGATNVPWRISLDGIAVGQGTLASVAANTSAAVNFSFNATTGNHVVEIAVDPNGSLLETTLSNNIANVTISVGSSPQPFNLTLANSGYRLDGGANVTITFSVVCTDGSGVGASNVPWSVTIDGVASASGTISTIAAGSSAQISTVIASASGTHDFSITIDPNATIAQSSTSDDSAVVHVVNTPNIDVRVRYVEYSFDLASAVLTFHLYADLEGPSGTFANNVPWNIISDGTLVAQGTIASIANGVMVLTHIPISAATGQHVYVITLDHNHQIAQYRRDNDSWTDTVYPDAPAPAAGSIDVALDDPHYHGGYDDPGVKLHFHVQNKNAASTRAWNVTWAVYRDGVRIFDGVIPHLDVVSDPTLAAELEWYYWETVPGTHTYELAVDPDNAILESNEGNNSMSWAIDVPAYKNWAVTTTDLRLGDPHVHGVFSGKPELHFHVFNISPVGTVQRNLVISITDNGVAIPTTASPYYTFPHTTTYLAPGVDAEFQSIFPTPTPGLHRYVITISPSQAEDFPDNDVFSQEFLIPGTGG